MAKCIYSFIVRFNSKLSDNMALSGRALAARAGRLRSPDELYKHQSVNYFIHVAQPLICLCVRHNWYVKSMEQSACQAGDRHRVSFSWESKAPLGVPSDCFTSFPTQRTVLTYLYVVYLYFIRWTTIVCYLSPLIRISIKSLPKMANLLSHNLNHS